MKLERWGDKRRDRLKQYNVNSKVVKFMILTNKWINKPQKKTVILLDTNLDCSNINSSDKVEETEN